MTENENIKFLMNSKIHYDCKTCKNLLLYESSSHTLCQSCKNSHNPSEPVFNILSNRFEFCSSDEMRKRLRIMK